jgi:hypothetical protein
MVAWSLSLGCVLVVIGWLAIASQRAAVLELVPDIPGVAPAMPASPDGPEPPPLPDLPAPPDEVMP